jgi:hypothetical protein
MPPTLEIVQEHDFSLNLRKSPEGRCESSLKFRMLRRLFWSPASGRRSLGNDIRIPKNLATHQVAGTISYDSQKPTSESVGSPAIVQSLESDHECLLCSVLSVVVATRHREANGVGSTHVSAHEDAKGLAISSLRPPDQKPVRRILCFIHETPLPPAVLSLLDLDRTPKTHHPLGSLVDSDNSTAARSSRNRKSGKSSRESAGANTSPRPTKGSAAE